MKPKIANIHVENGLFDHAAPLIEAAMAAASGDPVPEDKLPQAALGLALQATINAAATVTGIWSRDVVMAQAVAFTGWATTVADNGEELEDWLIAFTAGVRKIGPVMLATRRAN